MIRCVAFDFDGTLVDSNAIKRKTFFEVVAAHDPEGAVAAEVLDEIRPGDRYAVTREVARILRDRGALPADADVAQWAQTWAEEYGRRCEAAVSRCPEIPGAGRALAWLEGRGIPRYINSATPEPSLRRTLERRPARPEFRLILGGPAGKLANLERIRADAGCEASGVLMVGDGEDDRSAAAEFGCPFVGIVRPGPRRFAHAPAICLDDLTGLAGVVRELDGDGP
jgi:phosphoglycolate phosphatase-like HAD superfamily hydrolase